MTNRNELERLLAAAKGRNNADQVALANHMTDNAQHYLSLMDEVERLREALQSVVNACDQGKLAPLGGPCGMTIEAQIRGSVYNRVPAWPVEEARAALAGETHDN